ncbi:hypothetical protein HK098_005688 [Nowakowskiella sp. JEL0407]|nr:hypothetical protein HK098_005688 [Nowakowskiella sp. JEL0407]
MIRPCMSQYGRVSPFLHCRLYANLPKLRRFSSSKLETLNATGDEKPALSIQQRISRGSRSVWATHTLRKSDDLKPVWTTTTISETHFKNSSPEAISTDLLSAFLPKGYPHSVSQDYLQYTIYFFIQSVTGTITSTLSMQALLQALGLSTTTSLGLAATTTWILKDGLGLLGGVMYASIISNKFDSHPKQFRFFSAVALQLATLAELITPLFPNMFLFLASASNIAKNIAYLASSATRASMHKGFCKEDNLGDVTGKAGAQSTAAGLIGTAGGVVISWIWGAEYHVLMTVFVPMFAINLWSAYMANLRVATRSIDVQRGEKVLEKVVVRLVDKSKDVTKISKAQLAALMPSPENLAPHERFVLPYRSEFKTSLNIEPPIEKVLGHLTLEEVDSFLQPVQKENYRILIASKNYVSSSWGNKSGRNGRCVNLWFTENSTSRDLVKGFYHACILRELLTLGEENGGYLELSNKIVDRSFDDVWEIMKEKGWDVAHSHIAARNARIRWVLQ